MAQYAGQVGRVARTVSMMAGLINSEVKFADTNLNTSLLNTGTTQVHLCSIPQGDEYNQRNGRSILLKNLDMRLYIRTTGANANVDPVGWALIMDKKPDEPAIANWSTVFGSLDPFGHVDKETESGRFIILARGQTTLYHPERSTTFVKRYINLKGLHVKYDGTASSDYDANPIYLIGITSQATNPPQFQGEARLNYYDN